MICLSCHREIGDVLLLSHGRQTTACPLCKKDPTGENKLFITQENEELYRLSEQYYYKWLTSKKTVKDEENYLTQSLRCAERSAAMGNPRATVRLGYFYDKDYLGADFGEIQRCRFAYNYYRKVIDHKEEFRGENEKLTCDSNASQALKVHAARFLLDMLSATPEELDREPLYSFARNREQICSKLGMSYERTEREARGADEKSDQLFRTLRTSCFSKERAPLLGVSRLPWEELKALLLRRVGPNGTGKNALVDYLKNQRVEISCVACSDDGNAGDGEFHALKNSDGLDAVEPYMFSKKRTGYSGYVWLFFFNRRGKHRLGPKEISAISRAFEENEYSLARALIGNNSSVDCTLFDDDVILYAEHGHGWRRAVEKLTENIGGTEI